MGSLQFDQNPLSLGIIGLMEVIPAISMALFGHIVDQRKKKVCFSNVFWDFQLLVWAYFLLGLLYKRFYYPNYFILHLLFVFLGGLALFCKIRPLFWP
jgi:hypothetical protein